MRRQASPRRRMRPPHPATRRYEPRRPTRWQLRCLSPKCWVLDTNIVLDLWVFADPQVQPLRDVLGLSSLSGVCPASTVVTAGTVSATAHAATRPLWLATRVMRDELARVLTYPHLVRRQPLAAHTAEAVLAAYDAAVTWCEVAPKARFVCTDADDQKFIDLAVAHRAALVSKDKAVLRLRKRLATLGVPVMRAWSAPCPCPCPCPCPHSHDHTHAHVEPLTGHPFAHSTLCLHFQQDHAMTTPNPAPVDALSPDDFDALDTILDDLRQRDDEVPQWEFCEGFLAAVICCREPITDHAAMDALFPEFEGEEPLFASDEQRQQFAVLWAADAPNWPPAWPCKWNRWPMTLRFHPR
jgi:predicted nucleic acid-binding protein